MAVFNPHNFSTIIYRFSWCFGEANIGNRRDKAGELVILEKNVQRVIVSKYKKQYLSDTIKPYQLTGIVTRGWFDFI